MQPSQRHAFDQLVCFEKLPPDMYDDKGDLYSQDYVGPRKCHLRALYNVHKEATVDGLKANIKHNTTRPDKVRAISKNHEKYAKVFNQ